MLKDGTESCKCVLRNVLFIAREWYQIFKVLYKASRMLGSEHFVHNRPLPTTTCISPSLDHFLPLYLRTLRSCTVFLGRFAL